MNWNRPTLQTLSNIYGRKSRNREKQKVNVRQFIAAVRKYTDMQQLDASVLREFSGENLHLRGLHAGRERAAQIKVREIEIVP